MNLYFLPAPGNYREARQSDIQSAVRDSVVSIKAVAWLKLEKPSLGDRRRRLKRQRASLFTAKWLFLAEKPSVASEHRATQGLLNF